MERIGGGGHEALKRCAFVSLHASDEVMTRMIKLSDVVKRYSGQHVLSPGGRRLVLAPLRCRGHEPHLENKDDDKGTDAGKEE